MSLTLGFIGDRDLDLDLDLDLTIQQSISVSLTDLHNFSFGSIMFQNISLSQRGLNLVGGDSHDGVDRVGSSMVIKTGVNHFYNEEH